MFSFSSDPEDTSQYLFIDNFCGTESDTEILEMYQNGVSGHVQFGIQSFSFLDQPTAEIYMHCQV